MIMEEQSETLSSKKEFAFASSTILAQVGRGVMVGLVVGIIVGSFRFLIEKGFHLIQGLYQDQAHLVRNLFIIGLFYLIVCWLSAKLTRSEKDIKGSGILKPPWCSNYRSNRDVLLRWCKSA